MPRTTRKYGKSAKHTGKSKRRGYSGRATSLRRTVATAGSNKLFYMPSVIPPRVVVPHTYVTQYTGLTVSTTAPSTWTFRLNSLYDPEYDNNGKNQQPRGYDRMASAYGYYLVRRVKVETEIVASPASAGSSGSALQWNAAAYPGSVGNSAPPAVQYLSEQPGGKKGLMGLTNGKSEKSVMYVDIKKLAGQVGTAFNSSLGSLSNGNPGNPQWFTLAAQGIGAVGATVTASIIIRITYITEWSLPNWGAENDDKIQPPDQDGVLPTAIDNPTLLIPNPDII